MMWESVRLGDVCDVRDGTHNSPKYFATGFPLVTSKNIKDGNINLKDVNYISEMDFNEINKRSKVDKGDILLPMIGTIGNPIIVSDEPFFAIKNVCLLKMSDKLANSYLYYVLISNLFKENLFDKSKGGTQKFISLGDIRDFKIPLPPLPIQKRIAEILDAADALKRKDQQLLKKYDELAQAIFIDMFGDPVKNEKGWEVKTFSEMGTLDRGVSKHRPRNAPELLGGIYPLIQTGDVANSGGFISKYKSSYSEIGLKQSKLWKKGTLCITIAANIAKTGVLEFDACFPDSIVGFKPDQLKCNVLFIQFWIGFLQKILEDNAPESAQKNINLEILRNLEVISPPIKLQNIFKDQIKVLILQKELLKKDTSNNLFNSLIQKAFKGELVE